MDNATPVFVEMFEWRCAECGLTMTMPEHINNQLRQSHKIFYCIHGHSNVYSKKTPIEEIEGKLMNEYAKNAQLEDKIKELEKTFLNRIFKK